MYEIAKLPHLVAAIATLEPQLRLMEQVWQRLLFSLVLGAAVLP